MQEQIKKHLSTILNTLKTCGIPTYLFERCIGIYLCVSAIHIIKARQNDLNVITSWQEHIQNYPLKMTVLWVLILLGFVSLFYYFVEVRLKREIQWIDPALLISGTLLFSCVLLWRNDDFYLCIGICLMAIALITYGVSKLKCIHIENIRTKWVIFLIAVVSVLVMSFVCVTAVAKHRTFGTTCYDMGIFVQMFHSLSHHLTAVTTCERDMLLSHFNVHASYIFYLLVPIYALFPSENTLIIAQAVMTVSGVIPMYLIAKNRDFKGIALLSACMIYLFSDGLLAPCYYHFHENAFLPPLLLWLLYAVEKRNYKLFFVMSALVCIVKEDAPLYVICIALYLAIDDKSKNKLYALAVVFASMAYFLFITNWLTKNGDGSMMMATRFGNLTIDENDGFIGIIGNVLSNPSYFVSLFVKESTLLFLVEMCLPLLFLPFMTRKIHRYFLMIPFIIMNLVIGSGYSYAAIMGYQYTFGTSSLLIYMTIINIADFDTDRRNIATITAGAVSIITAFSLISGHISQYEDYKERKEHYTAIEECLDTIPTDGIVISNTSYLPHIADRDKIYLLGDDDFEKNGDEIIGLKNFEQYDFYVLSYGDGRTSSAIPYLESAGFTKFADCEGAIVIYQNPAYHGVS